MGSKPLKQFVSGASREVAVFVFNEANAIDVFGPLQVFNAANEIISGLGLVDHTAYSTQLVSLKNKHVRLSTHTKIVCDQTISQLQDCSLNTFVIAGGEPSEKLSRNPKLISKITPILELSSRVASVCSGAFILAACGVLHQRKATTHWRRYESFKRAFPDVNLDIDAIVTNDGKFYCSAGVTAGIDLALSLVQEDFGRRVAMETAREMVVYYHRPGGQTQFSNTLGMKLAQTQSLVRVQHWMLAHMDRHITIPLLAEKAAMSVRNFSRRFASETGNSPSRYLQLVRFNKARVLLEESTDSIHTIAGICGFSDGENMRRAFLRELNVTPSCYRDRFKLTS